MKNDEAIDILRTLIAGLQNGALWTAETTTGSLIIHSGSPEKGKSYHAYVGHQLTEKLRPTDYWGKADHALLGHIDKSIVEKT